jgi:hypothetical protein
MQKEIRSAIELADIVIQRLGVEDVSILVRPDNMYGWNAFAMSIPETEPHIHAKVQRAVEQLRKAYEIEAP